MDKRYLRNFPALSAEEQRILADRRILIVGCGGLGGYLLEYMTRIGVGHITVVDGDTFDETNLNRQILCTCATLGMNKALAAQRRAAEVNSAVNCVAVTEHLCQANADRLIRGQDLVLDALDSAASRLMLEDACTAVPIVHGAVSEWTVQAAIAPPGRRILHKLYAKQPDKPDTPISAMSFTPALCAAIQAAESVKLLLGQETALYGKLLIADLRDASWVMTTLSA